MLSISSLDSRIHGLANSDLCFPTIVRSTLGSLSTSMEYWIEFFIIRHVCYLVILRMHQSNADRSSPSNSRTVSGFDVTLDMM
jgi:hypothetical protein